MGRQSQDPVVVGIDVGSTTVKAVVLDPNTLEVLWSDYQRHQTKQPEKVLELIDVIEDLDDVQALYHNAEIAE